MLFKQDQLESKPQASVPAATVVPAMSAETKQKLVFKDTASDRRPFTLPYAKKEYTLTTQEPTGIYPKEVKVYAEQMGFKVYLCLQDALVARVERKEKAVSPREADILYRHQLCLKPGNMLEAIMQEFLDSVIVEDEPGPDSIWELRSFYNRGVAFMNSEACNDSNRPRAEKAMTDTLEKMWKLQLPAYAHEMDKGFSVELTKPEWMTWSQYEEAKSHAQKRCVPA